MRSRGVLIAIGLLGTAAAGLPAAEPSCQMLVGPAKTGVTARADQFDTALSARLKARAQRAGSTIGVAVIHVETLRTATVHGQRLLPLFSVFKLPLAVTVLHAAEAGQIGLDQKVRITPADVTPGWAGNTQLWSKPVKKSVRELLEYSMVRSDNTSSDQLLKLVGGPGAVSRHMRALGLEGIQIRASVRDFLADPNKNNRGSAEALARLLGRLQTGRLLKPASTAFLLGLMKKSQTGIRRLRGKLPPGTPVADKTGTGPAAAATHDVGLITLPGGRGHLAMAVLVTRSKLSREAQEDLIADLARIAYDWHVPAIRRAAGTAFPRDLRGDNWGQRAALEGDGFRTTASLRW